jgi:hypothetical protein
MEFWAHGKGAAEIGWGHPGDFAKCVTKVQEAIVKDGGKPLPDHEIKGLCSNLHQRATGARPGHAASEQGDHHGD